MCCLGFSLFPCSCHVVSGQDAEAAAAATIAAASPFAGPVLLPRCGHLSPHQHDAVRVFGQASRSFWLTAAGSAANAKVRTWIRYGGELLRSPFGGGFLFEEGGGTLHVGLVWWGTWCI